MDVAAHCPHCLRHTAVDYAPLIHLGEYGHKSPARTDHFGPLFYEDESGTLWWLGRCNACRRALLVANRGDRIFPTPQPAPIDERIPEPMASDLREAALCMTVAAFNGAATVARRAVQSACIAQGAAGGRLVDQIDSLLKTNKITAVLHRLAHSIRCIGNDGAHESKASVDAEGVSTPVVTHVDEEDARQVVEFAQEFCRSLYAYGGPALEQLTKRGMDPQGKRIKGPK